MVSHRLRFRKETFLSFQPCQVLPLVGLLQTTRLVTRARPLASPLRNTISLVQEEFHNPMQAFYAFYLVWLALKVDYYLN